MDCEVGEAATKKPKAISMSIQVQILCFQLSSLLKYLRMLAADVLVFLLLTWKSQMEILASVLGLAQP